MSGAIPKGESSPDKQDSKFNISESQRLKYLEYEEKVKQYIAEFETTQATFIENLEEYTKEVRSIADEVDNFHKAAVITNVVGSSVGIVGGIAVIAALVLSPFTFGGSLAVAGIGAATVGGVTGAVASVADNLNIKAKGKKVEAILNQANEGKEKMQKMLSSIDELIKEMKSLLGLQDVDIARLSGRGMFTAAEIVRMFHLAKLSTTAAQGVHLATRTTRIAAVFSGIFAAVFLVVDIACVVNGAKELENGAKTEEAKKMREVADELEQELLMMHSKSEEFKNCKVILQF